MTPLEIAHELKRLRENWDRKSCPETWFEYQTFATDHAEALADEVLRLTAHLEGAKMALKNADAVCEGHCAEMEQLNEALAAARHEIYIMWTKLEGRGEE